MMSLHTNFHQDWTNKIPLQGGAIFNLKSNGWCFLPVSLTTDNAIMVAVGKKSGSRGEEQEANIVYTMGLDVEDFTISI